MASGGNSTAISSSSSLVKKFMSDHPHVNYINKEVFCQCYHKIKPWLNISCLQHLFMKYRLVNNSDEMKAISSSYLQASDKSIALVEMIEKGGENGYMIFYICIYESSSGNIGHEDVLNILDSTAKELHTVPPWKITLPIHIPARGGCTKQRSASSGDEYQDCASFPGDPESSHGSIASSRQSSVTDSIHSQISASSILSSGNESSDQVRRGHPVIKTQISALSTTSASSITSASSDIGDSDIPEIEAVQSNIRTLEDTLSDLAVSFMAELRQKGIQAESVIDWCSNVPRSMNREGVIDALENKELEDNKTLSSLFRFLGTQVWNFIDYHLLEFIISRLGSESLQQRMKDYVSRLQEFRRSTSMSSFIQSWSGRFQKPEDYDEVTATFDNDAQSCTIEFVDQWRRQLQEKLLLLPPLSKFCAMLYYKHKNGCFVVTWILPQNLADTLKKNILAELPQISDFLREYFISSILIQNDKVYPPPVTPVMSRTQPHVSQSTCSMSHTLSNPSPCILRVVSPVLLREGVNKLGSMSSMVTNDSGLGNSSWSLAYTEKGSHHGSKETLSSIGESDSPLPNRLPPSRTPSEGLDSGNEEDSSSGDTTPRKGEEEDDSLGSGGSAVDPADLTRQLLKLKVNFERLPRDKRTDQGCYPDICLNNSGLIVEVNHQMATNWMFYRVGQLTDNKIEWGSSSSNDPPMKKYLGNGAYPKITLNDNGRVIEVHKGQFFDKCVYRVGWYHSDNREIDWGLSHHYSFGYFPTVALSNDGIVVSVFQDNLFTKHLNYRIGKLSQVSNEITWISKHRTKITADSFSLSMNNNKMVVLGYQTIITNHIHCCVGRIDCIKGTIVWSKNIHVSKGFTPSITLNDRNYVVMTHQSTMGRRLTINVGVAYWDEQAKEIDWTMKENLKSVSNDHFGHGIYLSSSLNNNMQVVEVNEPPVVPGRNKLRYYLGEVLDRENELKTFH